MIVSTLTVDDFSGLMSRNNMLPIIIFAIISGGGPWRPAADRKARWENCLPI